MHIRILVFALSLAFAALATTAVYLAYNDSSAEIYREWEKVNLQLTARPQPGESSIQRTLFGKPTERFQYRLSREDTYGREFFRVFRNNLKSVVRVEQCNEKGELVFSHSRKFDDRGRMIEYYKMDADESIVEHIKAEFDDKKYIAMVYDYGNTRAPHTITEIHFEHGWNFKTRIIIRSDIRKVTREEKYTYWPNKILKQINVYDEFGIITRHIAYNRKGNLEHETLYYKFENKPDTPDIAPAVRKNTVVDHFNETVTEREFSEDGQPSRYSLYVIRNDERKLRQEIAYYQFTKKEMADHPEPVIQKESIFDLETLKIAEREYNVNGKPVVFALYDLQDDQRILKSKSVFEYGEDGNLQKITNTEYDGDKKKETVYTGEKLLEFPIPQTR